MAFQTVFKRYELKYMITWDQQARILKAMETYMVPDRFGKSTIRNIYFDTDDHILARHSIAKPDFKEKLRIRSYKQATEDSTVFVELKRKFDHVVYKRRVALPEHVAMGWTQGLSRKGSVEVARCIGSAEATKCNASTEAARCNAFAGAADSSLVPTQMTKEIDYLLSYYGHLRPAAFISYDRQAFRMRDTSPELNTAGGHDQDFRVTFDDNILFRDHDLSLTSDVYGEPLLEEGKILMELKCAGGIPLWMTKVLSEEHVYKTSFSKYGTAYTKYIQPEQQRIYATARAVEIQSIYAAAQATGSQSIYASSRVTEPQSINASSSAYAAKSKSGEWSSAPQNSYAAAAGSSKSCEWSSAPHKKHRNRASRKAVAI